MSDFAFWCLLSGVAFVTSVVSGIAGMAGGMLLLSAMLLRLEPIIAIPIHGVVQLVSNASRAWFQRKHIMWGPVWRFALPLFPAAVLGVSVARRLPSGVALLGVSAFILGAVWAPRLFDFFTKPRGRAELGLSWAGALVGFLSPLIGATGPLLGPFVLVLGLAPASLVGTVAACQVFQHASKVLLFGVTGFDFESYWLPALGLSAAAIAGSALGTRLLTRMDARKFGVLIRIVLSVAALKLAADGVLSLLEG